MQLYFSPFSSPLLLLPSFFLVLYRESQYNILYTTYPSIPTRRKQNPLRYLAHPPCTAKRYLIALQHFSISAFSHFSIFFIFIFPLSLDRCLNMTKVSNGSVTPDPHTLSLHAVRKNPHSAIHTAMAHTELDKLVAEVSSLPYFPPFLRPPFST